LLVTLQEWAEQLSAVPEFSGPEPWQASVWALLLHDREQKREPPHAEFLILPPQL